ncbi:hypothetical protein [Bosea sp. BH3]|uniref:hypothetical protein n=1 Tax=Bosea sp. BH3 TaxID=2871701 RepID=UPI0021CB47B6|nr:hypothetical protein [Bosea sp. BH3]MCU4179855.1 hypothetical protein [Bosea sp. BH3]
MDALSHRHRTIGGAKLKHEREATAEGRREPCHQPFPKVNMLIIAWHLPDGFWGSP